MHQLLRCGASCGEGSAAAVGMRVSGSTSHWSPTSQQLGAHQSYQAIPRSPNKTVQLGTAALPGQSASPGYGELHTTSEELPAHDSSAFAVPAVNKSLALGTQALPYEGYYE